MKIFRALFGFCLLVGLTCSYSSKAQVVLSDSLALVALYNSTNGPGWTTRTNWLVPGRPVSTWYGITVTGNRVTQINMNPANPPFSGNNLIGTLPAQLGSLTGLTSLDLAYNRLSGSIPTSLGNLVNLVFLNLSNAQLTGTIPSQLGNLSNLTVLLLNNNQLSGQIPTQLGSLAKATQINLTFNRLTGSIPAQLGNLTNLVQLLLDNNQLTGSIPGALGLLSKLTSFSLSENQLSGNLPTQLGNLSALVELNLSNNLLTGGIPTQLGSLSNLQFLRINRNQLNGSVPKELGNLTKLRELLVGNNQLTGIVPNEIATISTLTNVQLQSNFLTAVPTFSKSLVNLNVSTNNLTFEDLEPNMGIANYIYSPQRIIPGGETRNLIVGETFTKSFSVGGTANQYQWRKNGVNRAGATSNTLTIAAVDFPDAGTYELFITNSIVPNLTLQTEPTTLTVTGVPIIGAKTEDGISQPNGATINFELTEVGDQRIRQFEISNTGSATLSISSITVTGDFNLENTPPTQIDVNESETLSIRFVPTEIGSRTGTLTIFSNSNIPVFTLNLIGEGNAELEIYNVVTTNPNGKHDYLNIRNIWLYPQNRIQIFDRWGNPVYDAEGYDNNTKKFTGISDKGKELPEGTYYYVLNKDQASEALTGFIFLRRN